ncbi:AAA family ATPase [Bacillus safensis]|uniref:AAA family ATPase n=1 Tax=Bacillus safensis TaxID=561879 RepID=UPI00300096E0
MENSALLKLEKMPGMQNVKKQIEQIIALHQIRDLRISKGLPVKNQSLHLVFTGNPGTGKTTAARLIGEAFSSLGILKSRIPNDEKRPFVEIHHSDITSSLHGESEINIKRKFDAAKGGVLFIDEAYSFVEGDTPHRNGDRNIAVIVQQMEDLRDEVMVVVAGYKKEMEDFLNMNPGLRSRFSNTVHFDDYSIRDLIAISSGMLDDLGYKADKSFLEKLEIKLSFEILKEHFGNARSLRNILEESIRNQSTRVLKIDKPKKSDLMCLTASDLVLGVKEDVIPIKDFLSAERDRLNERLLALDLAEASGLGK